MLVLHVIFTLLHKLEATIKMTVYVTLGILGNQGMLAFNAFLVNIGEFRREYLGNSAYSNDIK